jgi:5'-3' exonuclease
MSYRNAIIDASWITRRNFEVGGGDALLEGSLRVAMHLHLDLPAARQAWVWDDRAAPKLRELFNPEYKAGRTPPGPDYSPAVQELQPLLLALGCSLVFPVPEEDGRVVEADDLAASMVQSALGPHLLVSADKDWLQLVAPDVHVARKSYYIPDQVVTPETIVALTGLDAEGWSAYLVLAGDTGDNVPGLPGVGPKRARDLIAACPNILGLLLDGEVEVVQRQVEEVDPPTAKWARLACRELALIRSSWDQVRLRVAPVWEEKVSQESNVCSVVDYLERRGSHKLAQRIAEVFIADFSDEEPL